MLNELTASLDPPKGNALLLTTNTEVSIAPKLHRNRDTPLSKRNVNGKVETALPPVVDDVSKPSSNSLTAATVSVILRVLPSRLVPSPDFPEHNGVALLAFVHPKTLAQLGFESSRVDPAIVLFSQGTYKMLTSPPNPSSSSAKSPPLAEPPVRVLNSATPGDATSSGVSTGPGELFIGTSDNIPVGHVAFIAMPEGLEEWDLVRYIYCQFVSSAQHI